MIANLAEIKRRSIQSKLDVDSLLMEVERLRRWNSALREELVRCDERMSYWRRKFHALFDQVNQPQYVIQPTEDISIYLGDSPVIEILPDGQVTGVTPLTKGRDLGGKY